jgi:hypothetical protein
MPEGAARVERRSSDSGVSPGQLTDMSNAGRMTVAGRTSYCGRDYRGMIRGMKVDKLSVSFDPDLGDAVRDAAQRAGRGLSGWLAEAAEAKLRAEALRDFLDDWEVEHGELTADELAVAAAEVGADASRVKPAA